MELTFPGSARIAINLLPDALKLVRGKSARHAAVIPVPYL